MRQLLFFVVFGLSAIGSRGQSPNLVPNPSFEDTIVCPSGLSKITSACADWIQYTWASTDYFHICNTDTYSVSVPLNRVGFQQAADGIAYAGIITHDDLGSGRWHEYMHATLLQALTPGKMYKVSLFASLANYSKYATGNIGVYFFDSGPTFVSGTAILPYVPQVSFASYGIITDTLNWTYLKGTFVADSAFDNIVVGSFNTTSNAYSYTQVRTTNYGEAYYYIDLISVEQLDTFYMVYSDSMRCHGDSITISYFTSFSFDSSNTFTLQLSDSVGDFANATNIGYIQSDTTGVISGIIPITIVSGDSYRLRVIASSPVDSTQDNGFDIGIGTSMPAKPTTGNNSPVCYNDTLKLTAQCVTPGVSYRWSGPNGFSSTLQNLSKANPLSSDSGDYIVSAYIYGCESKDTTTATVYTGSGPTNLVATTNAPVCTNDSLKLYGIADNTAANYNWIGPNGFTSSQQNPAIPYPTVLDSGDYYLLASDGTCTSRDTVTVTVKPRPANFSVVSNSPICAGNTLNFTASSTSPGVTYTWAGPNGFNSTSATPFISNANPINTGDYYVTATLNGCSLDDTIGVTIIPLPVKPIVTNNSPICAGDTLKLSTYTSTAGVNYTWTGPNSYADTVQNPSIGNSTVSVSGIYTSTVIKNGCSISDTTLVLVKPLPSSVTLTNNGPLCEGDTLILNSTQSTSGVTYYWSGPGTFNAGMQNVIRINTSPSMSGWYKMTLDLNGCEYNDSTQAFVYPVPVISGVSYNTPICEGDTLKLSTGNQSGTFSWIGPGNFSTNNQYPVRSNIQFGDTGIYKATVTVNGCTSPADSVKVMINPLPFVVIFPTPGDSICAGGLAAFTALPNNHGGTPAYQWYINGLQVGNNSSNYSSTMLNHGDVVRCDMTESTKCNAPYTDQSNDVEMKVLPWLAPSVSITANPNRPLDPDEYVTFTATVVNGGNLPKYQWKRNGQDVQGATSAVWSANTLNDNDSISVEIESNYKCPQPLSAVSNGIRVKVLTGVDELKLQNLTLYPNPNDGGFTLSADNVQANELQIEVVNALGQTVYLQQVKTRNNNLQTNIQLNDAAAGVYLLRISSEDGSKSIRFLVE